MRTFSRYFKISESEFVEMFFKNLQTELDNLQEIDEETGVYLNRYFTNLRELLILKYGVIEHYFGAKFVVSAHKSKLKDNKPKSFYLFFDDVKELTKRFNMIYRINKEKNNRILKI